MTNPPDFRSVLLTHSCRFYLGYLSLYYNGQPFIWKKSAMEAFTESVSDRLEYLTNHAESVDCVVLPHEHVDAFVAWCEDTTNLEAFTLSENETEVEIYTDDEMTYGKCEFNLITTPTANPDDRYDDYGIVTQISSPFTKVAADGEDVERTTVIDFRDPNDTATFADWAMGVTGQ